MGEVSTIGLDIAKSVFQVHGVDGTGAVVIRKRVNRTKVLEFFGGLSPCLIGIEACPSAHYWSRELQALGHTVRLLPRAGNGCRGRISQAKPQTRPFPTRVSSPLDVQCADQKYLSAIAAHIATIAT
jgi:hypothetical protein